jgi:hypothetical protein
MGKQMVWLAIPWLLPMLKRSGTGNKSKKHIRSCDHRELIIQPNPSVSLNIVESIPAAMSTSHNHLVIEAFATGRCVYANFK